MSTSKEMFLHPQKQTYMFYKTLFCLLWMSESQSRYSIVERLTQKKIDIMSEKLGLESDLKHRQQKVEQLKKELADWESDIQQDIERNKRLKEREIEKALMESDNAKERKNARENTFNDKIKAIELALERIEEISKTSPTTKAP